jgi:5'-nucleotidase
MTNPHFLLTNDDGIGHPGLLAMKRALDALGRVTVVAPSRNYSTAGHRKTLHKPLRIDETHMRDGTAAWVCSGAPSDCVALALLGFVKEKIDLVVSGINPNANLGQDVTYSGTVTAALEAVINGVPGVAVSMVSGEPPQFEAAATAAACIIQTVLERSLPPGVMLNVNFPAGPEYKGVRVTRQGDSVYRDELVERLDPRGRPYYWIGGEIPSGRQEERGTDFWALAQGYASVTPLRPDLTAPEVIPELVGWDLKITG